MFIDVKSLTTTECQLCYCCSYHHSLPATAGQQHQSSTKSTTITADFIHANLKTIFHRFHQHVEFATKGENKILNLVYIKLSLLMSEFPLLPLRPSSAQLWHDVVVTDKFQFIRPESECQEHINIFRMTECSLALGLFCHLLWHALDSNNFLTLTRTWMTTGWWHLSCCQSPDGVWLSFISFSWIKWHKLSLSWKASNNVRVKALISVSNP